MPESRNSVLRSTAATENLAFKELCGMPMFLTQFVVQTTCVLSPFFSYTFSQYTIPGQLARLARYNAYYLWPLSSGTPAVQHRHPA